MEERYRRDRNRMLASFVILTLVILALGIGVPKLKDLSYYADHGPIIINGNAGFISANGVTSGNGTMQSPYVIESLRIFNPHGPCIIVINTNLHLTIRNVTVYEGQYRVDYGVGYYYYRSYHSSYGLLIRDSTNVSIENLNAVGLDVCGASVEGLTSAASQVRFTRCTITACQDGIVARNVSDLVVENCYFDSTGRSPLALDGCRSVSLLSNTLDDFGTRSQTPPSQWPLVGTPPRPWPFAGISLRNILDVRILDNLGRQTYYDSDTEFDYTEIIGCGNVTFSRNTMHGYSPLSGLTITGSHDISTDQNVIRRIVLSNLARCTVTGSTISILTVTTCTDTNISSNHFYGDYTYTEGVIASGVSRMTVEYNVAEDCSMSLGGSDVTVRGNAFTLTPLFVWGSNILVDSNLFNASGLAASGSNHLRIENNSIGRNGEGWYYNHLKISSSANVSVKENNISGRVLLESVSGLVSHNLMYRVDGSWSGTLVFDSGYPAGGNFWSNYNGTDNRSGEGQNLSGSDGIGDTPYMLDRYPIMSPSGLADSAPPMTSAFIAGYRWASDWFVSQVNVTLVAGDSIAGVSNTTYRVDEGPWMNYSAPIWIKDDGIHSLDYFSIDWAGNPEPVRHLDLKIDTQGPTVLGSQRTEFEVRDTKVALVGLVFADNMSGVGYYSFVSNARVSEHSYQTTFGSAVPFNAITLFDGVNEIEVMAVDAAGNSQSVRVVYNDNLNEDRALLSAFGPYGPWFLMLILGDLTLLIAVYELNFRSKPPPPREERQLDKETVIDGYPKYLKRM